MLAHMFFFDPLYLDECVINWTKYNRLLLGIEPVKKLGLPKSNIQLIDSKAEKSELAF